MSKDGAYGPKETFIRHTFNMAEDLRKHLGSKLFPLLFYNFYFNTVEYTQADKAFQDQYEELVTEWESGAYKKEYRRTHPDAPDSFLWRVWALEVAGRIEGCLIRQGILGTKPVPVDDNALEFLGEALEGVDVELIH